VKREGIRENQGGRCAKKKVGVKIWCGIIPSLYHAVHKRVEGGIYIKNIGE